MSAAIDQAVIEANAGLPPTWTIGLLTERRFAFRDRYTVVAYRSGIPVVSWPGVYDVRRLLPLVVERIGREAA